MLFLDGGLRLTGCVDRFGLPAAGFRVLDSWMEGALKGMEKRISDSIQVF